MNVGLSEHSLVLVSCSSTKLRQEAPAGRLYQGAMFRKSRELVRAVGATWFILSGKHGLVDPHESIKPYNVRLATMPWDSVERWGSLVSAQARQLVDARDFDNCIVLAGQLYLHAILATTQRWEREGMPVVDPLEGLGIGERLAWLNQALAAVASADQMDLFG